MQSSFWYWVFTANCITPSVLMIHICPPVLLTIDYYYSFLCNNFPSASAVRNRQVHNRIIVCIQ